MADEFDVDEWDPSRGTLAEHIVAGSSAGLAEHLVMFPVDTIKTRLQARPVSCSPACDSSMTVCVRRLMREGMCAPWKGSGTVLIGCIPAHAAYFSIYESLKLRLSTAAGSNDHPLAASAAVAVAAVVHDSIMTPMDVMKQRLQLGYHSGVLDCARHILRTEGVRAFYMSFGVTLLMNVPYAAVMGGTNEALRHALAARTGEHTTSTYLLSGAGAGVVAATLTNPLDVVKTRLQTQHLAAGAADAPNPPLGRAGKATAAKPAAAGPLAGALNTRHAHSAALTPPRPLYTSLSQTVLRIWAEEGWRGFGRGIGPRALYHAPSVAISWTTYETVKHALARLRRPDE